MATAIATGTFTNTALVPVSDGGDIWDAVDEVDGPQLPDPITFVIGPQWLDRPNLYPRQATLLKIIFLRDDLFTDYDHQVIGEWIAEFHATNPDAGPENKFRSDTNGIQPDIYERIAWLKARGYRWFKEVIFAIGRRGGKGYVCALAMAYVLWAYLERGNPQDHYGIDRDKQLAILIFAGKKEQAVQNLWGDLDNVITGAPCFGPYISTPQTATLTVFAPYDKVRRAERAGRGINSTKDIASFAVLARESTLLAGRGPAGAVDPRTLVLKSDLTWVPINDIRPGDHVVGLDEFPDMRYRRLRDSVVEKTWTVRKPALLLRFDDGTSVTCSADHRWLWREKGAGGTMHWREAGKLKVGHDIKFLAEPWEFDETREAGYLSGIFDGEGCVPDHSKSNSGNRGIHVSQNPGIVLDEIHRCLKERGFAPVPHGSGAYKKSERYLCQQWSLRGIAECMRFLGSVRPPRLMKVASRVWEGAALRGGYSQAGRFLGRNKKTIVEIVNLPDQDLIDIQTSSRTFIANGFISHNCILGFDEAAHVKNAGTSRAFGDVYGSATPALDQFGRDAFICIPSSTWEMTGMFYELWEQSLEQEPDDMGELRGVYPNKLMLQLASWDPYIDWAKAHELDLFPAGFTGDLGEYLYTELPRLKPLKGALQVYDEEMAKKERANPDTFAVERRSHWATSMEAYLNPGKVDAMFAPWEKRPPEFGRPELQMQISGPMTIAYRAHGDPANVNCRFGFAMAHTEKGPDGYLHAVFDLIKFWDPANYDDHFIDYDEVTDWIFDNVVLKFRPSELTFDQFNVPSTVKRLQKKIRGERLPKRVQVYERPATQQRNWATYECFKGALNMGFVHAPAHEEARDELKFVQKPEKLAKVVPPESGPVTTKDIADCYSQDVEVLTEHGWKLFPDVLDGERVATRNERGELEYQHFTQRIARHYTGPVYQFEGDRLNFSVTPKHRMLVLPRGEQDWRFIHAEDLEPGRFYKIPKTTVVVGREPGIVDIDSDRLPVPVAGRRVGAGATPWSAEEDAWLTENYASMPMDRLLQGLPGRTRSSACQRAAKQLGLMRGQIGDRHGDRPKPLPPVSRELFASFLGIWLADGRKYHSGSHRGYGVMIRVIKERKVSFLDDLLRRMDWPFRRSTSAKGETVYEVKSYGLREYLKALCVGEHDLRIPDEVFVTWTADEMRALLDGLLTGDGNFSQRERRFTFYSSVSRMLVDDIQRLMLHAGASGRVRMVREAGTPVNFPDCVSRRDLWQLSYDVRDTARVQGSQIEQVHYDGMVYCLTVPNSTLLVRREGAAMWSGNCIAIVTAELLGEQMVAFLADELSAQRPGAGMHTSSTDPMSRFDPSAISANPLATALSGAALSRGARPGSTRIRFPGSRPQSANMPGMAAMRRHRS